MKKKLVIFLVLAIIFAIPFSVFAATSDTQAAKAVRGFLGIDVSKLNEQQKADVEEYSKKMADLKKEFINKMVENGSITKEKGDAAIEKIDEMLENGLKGFANWFGGFKCFAKGRSFNNSRIDVSNLTDEQKADLKESIDKIVELQKELINKMAANSLLTEEQANAITQKLDSIISNDENLAYGLLLGEGLCGNFGFWGINGIKIYAPKVSELTEQQEKDLIDYFNKMADLKKELVNKMVTYSLITKEQGDNCIQKIDEVQKDINENGLPDNLGWSNGKAAKKGGFRGAIKKGAMQKGNSGLNNIQ